MNGELDSRLPAANEGGDLDKVARAVNLMLDEITHLLDQLKSVGDNIAHDLRTPLAVARARIERTLNNEAGIEELRAAMEAALAQIEKVSIDRFGDLAYFHRRKRRAAVAAQALRPQRGLC